MTAVSANLEHITADEAIEAMTAQAFRCQPGEDEYRRAVEAVRALCRDTDGNNLPGESQLPVGEFQAVLAEALGSQRVLVHCFKGSHGTNWDLDDAIKLIRRASEIGWYHLFASVDPFGRHDLAVRADGSYYHFQVHKPEEDPR